MRAPVLAGLVLAAVLLCVVALVASRSTRVRAEVRGMLEGVGLLPTWQESTAYRAMVQAHGDANAHLEHPCVLLVGDSLSEGFPMELTPAGWVNRGISGDRVRHVQARLVDSVFSAPCERVALLVGTNDVVGDGAGSARVSRELIALVDAVGDADRRVLVHTLPPLGADRRAQGEVVADINARLAEAVATRPGVRLVDLHAALAGPDGFLPIALGEDGIHLTPAGYQRWAALLAEVLGDPSQPAP